jgi:hypothetical protein
MARFSRDKTVELDAKLRPLIEEQRLQQHAVAMLLGVSEDWVQRACKRLRLATQRTGPRAGAGHPEWRGGKTLLKGYVMVWNPDHPNATKHGYVAEHRLVAEQILGRLLTRREVVHHKDGNPRNNHPSNLQVFDSNADHLRHELSGRIPNWTESGKIRIAEGVKKAAATHRRPISGDGLPLQSTDHPT